MMRAAFYGRYSSHAQKDTSIEQQLRECREWAQRNDVQIVAEYADRALTGKNDKREQFQKLIRDSAKGKWQLVLCYKVDRFARNRYDSATYKARLKKNGVRVVYAKESIPDGPEGILLESVLEGSAEYYSANLSQNIRRGLRENALECKVNNGAMPLGYQKGADGRFAIEPAGAAIVRDIFEMYADGLNITQINAALNARGVRTSTGGRWNKNSLHRLLRNEKYIGVYTYADVRVEGGLPAILSKELFEAVQERMKKVAKAPAANRTDVDFVLTGNVVYANGHTKSKFELKQPYQCKAKSREKIILAAFTFDKVFCRFTIALIAISVCRLQCKGKVYKIRYRCVATRRLLYG